MARTREFDEDEVLKALRDVFWEHGFDGTSYADIMASTGLQKGSLYAAFGDKRALYQKAIETYDRDDVTAAVKMLSDSETSGAERIGQLMDVLIQAAETKRGRWGCLLCNAATDQAPSEPSVEATVMASMNRLKSAIALALADTNSSNLSEWIWATYFGARVLIKAGANKETLQMLKAQVLQRL